MLTRAQIVGQIKTIGTRGANLDKLIQETAVGILHHIQEHREVSLVNKLYNAMPNGSRKLALAHWFHRYAPVVVNKGDDSKTIPFKFNAEGAVKLEEGAAKMWYDCKKERELKEEAFDLDAKLYALKAYIQKAQEKGQITEVDPRVAVLLGMEVKEPAGKKAAA